MKPPNQTGSRAPSAAATAAALNVVADLVPTLARKLATGRSAAAADGPSPPLLRLLERLYGTGGQSVPALARAGGTSRQFAQRLVEEAVGRDLVAMADNPAHRRSRLARLTDAGRQTVVALLSSQGAVLEVAARELTADDVEAAVRVLEALSAACAAAAGRQDR